MFYKLMNGEIVVDLLRDAQYVRYLPRAKRWVNTDALSANGILGGDGDTVYHLYGRACACPENLIKVRPIQIEEAEFLALKSQMAASQAENKALRQEIDALKEQLDAQSSLLQQILAKL